MFICKTTQSTVCYGLCSASSMEPLMSPSYVTKICERTFVSCISNGRCKANSFCHRFNRLLMSLGNFVSKISIP